VCVGSKGKLLLQLVPGVGLKGFPTIALLRHILPAHRVRTEEETVEKQQKNPFLSPRCSSLHNTHIQLIFICLFISCCRFLQVGTLGKMWL